MNNHNIINSNKNHLRNSHDPSNEHSIEIAFNRISNEYHLMLDISHSTSYYSSTITDEDNHLINSLGYTLLPYYNNLHPNLKPLEKKYIHHNIKNNSYFGDGEDISNLRRRRRTSSYHGRGLNEHDVYDTTDTTNDIMMKVAITSNSIQIENMKVGILSIVSTDDSLIDNLSLKEVEQLYMNESEFTRWIIDEAMCLRNQEANIIIMISKASFNLNKHMVM